MVIFLSACISSQTNTTEVVVLRDVTEKNMIQPKADDILKLYDFSGNNWNGGRFRFSDISQVSRNQTQQVRMESANQWLSNKFQREDDINHFQKSITEIVNKAGQVVMGKDNSSIYIPIAKELNLLSQSKSEKRIFIVYSDLMENTEELSFYRKNDFALLETEPKLLQEKFEKLSEINSLSGIQVWFIYQPSDPISDKQFNIISEFYRKLLESKGAKVNISANLNF
jgi:hypothetical protein